MAKKSTISFSITGTTLAGNEKTVQFDVTDYAGSIEQTAFRKVVTCMVYKPEYDAIIAEACKAFKKAKVTKEPSAIKVFEKDLAEQGKAILALRQSIKGMSAKKEERKADWKRKALASLDSVWVDSGMSRADKFGKILLIIKAGGVSIPAEIAEIDEDKVKKLGLTVN